MRLGQIIGTVVVVLGLVLIGFSIHAKHEIARASGKAQGVSKLFQDVPVIGGAVQGQINGTVDSYYEKATLAFLGGIGLGVIGVLVFVAGSIRGKHHK